MDIRLLDDEIVITNANRTPVGGFLGNLKQYTAVDLGINLINGMKIDKKLIDTVIIGSVLQAGMGQAPARQVAIGADLPINSNCFMVSKVCGSALHSLLLSCDMLISKSAKMIIAGGMESMSNAPYLMDKARSGFKMLHQKIYDHMFLDGLEDPYIKRKPMGELAEKTATEKKISKNEQDEYAYNSFLKARKAIKSNATKKEIIKIGEIDKDEPPFKPDIKKIKSLKPVFKTDGTITAASASSIADGAAFCTVTTKTYAVKNKIKPIARIIGYNTYSGKPNDFAKAPVSSTKKLLHEMKMTVNDIDLFEVNEAFALVAKNYIDDLKIPAKKVNIHGGACALGHPIGASGMRILVTLIYALKKYKLKTGIASICIGGGEAISIMIEVLGSSN